VRQNELESPAGAARPGPRRALHALRQQDWLALMLLALHAALVSGLDTPLSKAFMLSHFGCFLLWQPLVRSEQKLYLGQALLILAAAALLVTAENWWLIALWICVLFGLIGSEVPGITDVGRRVVTLLAATYLLSILLIWVVPHLFAAAQFSAQFTGAVRWAPLPLLALIVLTKTGRATGPPAYAVDLVYSLLLSLMVMVLVLGAFVIREQSQGNYVVALAQALVVTAGILLALGWLWDPRAGFAGIGQVMNRYLMSVGMPFERWMHDLANLAEQERDPDRFVRTAAQDMAALPWVSGLDWQTANDKGMAGYVTRHATQVELGALRLTLYTRWSPSPALALHIKLLARLLADYHEAKQREQEQRRNAYMHAIFETGSRLTHDVKNLLQSLNSLCSAVDASSEADAAALRRLLQRQLPQVSRRLQGTLDKLSRGPEGGREDVPAQGWWLDLRQRYAHEGVQFETGGIPATARIPLDVFDSVAENLLQNALAKRQAQPGIAIQARLDWDGTATLRVSDDGAPVPDAVSARLFQAPVASASGLGVGLYQAARLAAERGYQLELERNAPGQVGFRLGRTG
jgi:signal transduction histidine kinase